ncbi:hypothetical protein OOK31_26950 [Streptomyces sp. NBC_00249]|uniref:hypothetical protein n=1 Tax=Streptomyces sp. NBC_00249 TaxID=2975690 RepID=UPI0022583D82|nr:hypothetical protein [Streptomyces sp. NBC_00249]MCX5197491.1 hypothetical protein [Streptomyces sp. NBC_00249]
MADSTENKTEPEARWLPPEPSDPESADHCMGRVQKIDLSTNKVLVMPPEGDLLDLTVVNPLERPLLKRMKIGQYIGYKHAAGPDGHVIHSINMNPA